MRSLVRKYSQVIQRYYVQYLAGYDAVALAQMIQNTAVTSEEDNVLLFSICQKISELSVDNVEDPDHVFDFMGLRLDRGRLARTPSWLSRRTWQLSSTRSASTPGWWITWMR